jgi:hypothetical protein
MKAEILKIINTTLYYTSVSEGVQTAEAITALMCYQEVKAFAAAYTGDLLLNHACEYLEQQGYSEDTVWEAWQKYKSEQE